MEFEIILRNDKIKTYRLLTVFIVFLNCLYFLYLLTDKKQRGFGEIAIGTIAVYILYRVFKTNKQRVPFFIDEWVYFALMLLWIDQYLFAILNLIFMLQYTAATQTIRYVFSDKIQQKNFPWKKYQWSEMSNVVLKDNILTMDFKNNKVIQAEIDNQVDEKAFNSFVKSL